MKKIRLAVALICLTVLVGCSDGIDLQNIPKINNKIDNNTIKVAVLKNSGSQQMYFRKGIERAYNDVLEEYNDSNIKIECEFYDNNETYEYVDKLTRRLTEDKLLTAIIGSDMPVISENQLYITQKKGIILINPGKMNDDKMTTDNNLFFYMNYSNNDTGRLIKKISETLPEMNWAVCTADDNISRNEAQLFETSENTNVIDYCSMRELAVYFDNVIDRWKSLGIQGVVMIPNYDEGFDLMYRLKEKMPDVYIISDSDMDDQKEFEEHKKMYNNIYVTGSFSIDSSESSYMEYTEKKGYFDDTWETHGYNTFRMIVDTALQNNTTSSVKIAEIIHESGYKGKGENFRFEKNGILIPEIFVYADMNKMEIRDLPVE